MMILVALLLAQAQTTAPTAAPGLGATNVGFDLPMTAPATPPDWSDDFDGPTIDGRKWSFDVERNNLGWYNNEKQYYADARSENAPDRGRSSGDRGTPRGLVPDALSGLGRTGLYLCQAHCQSRATLWVL